jgi:hypothetical protein
MILRTEPEQSRDREEAVAKTTGEAVATAYGRGSERY